MPKYFDRASAKQIGERIREFRRKMGYSLEDLSSLTGFSVNTLSSIENGGHTYVSYIIAICQALEVPPAKVFEIEVQLKPRFELPPGRRNRTMTTSRVNQLFQSGFFASPQFVGDVLQEFTEVYGVEPDSSEISMALKKLTDAGKLTFTKEGRRNVYVQRED